MRLPRHSLHKTTGSKFHLSPAGIRIPAGTAEQQECSVMRKSIVSCENRSVGFTRNPQLKIPLTGSADKLRCAVSLWNSSAGMFMFFLHLEIHPKIDMLEPKKPFPLVSSSVIMAAERQEQEPVFLLHLSPGRCTANSMRLLYSSRTVKANAIEMEALYESERKSAGYLQKRTVRMAPR